MGLFARLFGWLWRRWGDYQSVVAILDLLDLKTALGGVFGFVAMIFFGATNMDWSPPAVLLAALAAGALVAIIMVAVRLLLMPVENRGNAPTQSTDAPSKTVTTRVAFSETQSIKHWPPVLGGNHVLRLDNVGILRFYHPSTARSITVLLDALRPN
jgi:hypothetical protein